MKMVTLPPLPLAQARGVPRSKRSAGPFCLPSANRSSLGRSGAIFFPTAYLTMARLDLAIQGTARAAPPVRRSLVLAAFVTRNDPQDHFVRQTKKFGEPLLTAAIPSLFFAFLSSARQEQAQERRPSGKLISQNAVGRSRTIAPV